MENEELSLGQRTGKMILDSAWTDAEIKYMEDAGVNIEDVIRHWVINGGDVTLTAAVGGLLTMKTNGTVERSRPNQTDEERNAETHADVQSHDMSGKPEHVSDLTSTPATQE